MAHSDVHDVVLRLGQNEASGRVSVGKQLADIIEVRIDEYAVRNPNGGAVTPSLWRLWFHDDFYQEPTTNARGRGYPIVIDNATVTHVVYTRPRVISRKQKEMLNWLQYEIRDENNNLVTFDDATFYLSFVTRAADWSEQQVMQEHWQYRTTPWPIVNHAYTTSVPDEVYGKPPLGDNPALNRLG